MTDTSHGWVDPAFSGVHEVFAASLADGQNAGAAVAVYADGRRVVDLWGGVADPRTGRAWEQHTPCPCFSCTKAVTATAALSVVQDGRLALDEPVAEWWPEFGVAGKESVTTEDLFTHRAGLPAFAGKVSADDAADPAGMAARLAAQPPEWEPGTRHGYHALTYGWLVGEIVRRHSGRSVADVVHEHFGPELRLGAPEPGSVPAARVVFPPREERHWAADRTVPADVAARLAAAYRDPDSLLMRAVGGDFLRPAVVADAVRTRVRGPDEVLLLETAYGLGYMRPSQSFPVPPGVPGTVFGHPGAGGSLGLGDLDHRLGFGFVANLHRDALAGDRRAYDLVGAVYAAL